MSAENDMAGFQCRSGHVHTALRDAEMCSRAAGATSPDGAGGAEQGKQTSAAELRKRADEMHYAGVGKVAIAVYRVGAVLTERLDALRERSPEPRSDVSEVVSVYALLLGALDSIAAKTRPGGTPAQVIGSAAEVLNTIDNLVHDDELDADAVRASIRGLLEPRP